ncbi:MAG: hypothetical protein ACXWSD_13770 [Bdellovibrionota bacterium]
MKWIFLLILVLVAVTGAEFWALRERAEATCHAGHELAARGAAVAEWIQEAAADPFLGSNALRGPPNALLAYYRDQARAIVSESSTRLLPEKPVLALQALIRAPEESPELVRALESLKPAFAGFECRKPPVKPSIGAEIDLRLQEGNAFWKERKLLAVQEKKDFARDRAIFCKGDKLLATLKNVVEAAGRACQRARAGSKMARNCTANPHYGATAVEAEIRDVEKEKEFNRRKLQQKWTPGEMAGLEC